MKDYVVPPMTATAKNEFHKVILMHFYMIGQSFYRMEEIYMTEGLRQLHPDVTLPSRKNLREKFLNHAYNEVKQKVDGCVDRGAYGSLTLMVGAT